MRTTNRILFLFVALLLTVDLGFSRGNPIMVIDLDCFGDELRNTINTREIPDIDIDCDEGAECPPMYMKIEFDEEQCKCVPDCEELFLETCAGCDEHFWAEPESVFDGRVGVCRCTRIEQSDINCGCPPWLTMVPDDGTVGYDYCDIITVSTSPNDPPCYDGEIQVISESVFCGSPDENGMITANVTVQVDPLDPCDGENGGHAVSIIQLQNCELTSGENFVIALADQYGADAVFAAECDGTIDLEFTFDPNDPNPPSWTYLNLDTEEEETLVLLSPENLCQAPIPTLSTWMLITLSLFLLISGLLFIKRKEVVKVLGMF